ncbi:2'-5' RNA ligase family protein [bacterium]|nr:2'-5' RNA ligase family protein [bacterium]
MVSGKAKTGAYAIATLLGGEPRSCIERIWHELLVHFGVRHPYKVPLAHFSYHVAENYDLEKIKPLISQFTAYKSVFKVHTEGIGFFNAAEPIIYIPVVRDPQFTSFHRSLCHVVDSWATKPLDYFHPDSWMPHITLVHGNIKKDILPQVLAYLAEKDFNWEVEVSNISVICSECTEFDSGLRFPLSLQGI